MSAQSKVKRPTYAQLRAQLVVMTAERDDLKRRFPNTFCSQCGGEFGPGDHGFSHCENHRHLRRIG